jgi:hypothetical protein
MTRILGFSAASILVLILYGTNCQAAISGIDRSAVIEPGIGVGNMRMGDDMATVLRKMGRSKPEGKTVKSGSMVEYWLSYAEKGITFIFNQNKILTRIAVSNPVFYVQQKGIRPKGSAAELDRLFGKGKTRKLNDEYEQKEYRDQGLTFTIDRNSNRIDTITITPRH